MVDLFTLCNISKQAHHQNIARQRIWEALEYLIVGLILQIREIHPGMGLRTMYESHQPAGIGRDAFISIGLKYGFRTIIFKNRAKTTHSSPYSRYKNLLVDKVLDNINQLWTSDLTYFEIKGVFYYVVLIMDVYSRKIVGFSVADNMRAEHNSEALKMAFKTRNATQFKELIHHSDRGGQYISDEYVKLLSDAKISISMCNEVHENAHIERVNGTIKNQYLKYRNINNFEELKKEVKRTVKTYNESKPHSALNKMPPNSFEQYIKELNYSQRPKLPIWTCRETKNINPNQCIMQF